MKVVIIGSSVAGFSVAEQLRAKNKNCSITILTEEAFLPYDRRKLVGYFGGTVKEKELFLNHPDYYGRENIVVSREMEAMAINCDRRKISVRNKEDRRESVEYDQLVIASGMKVVPPEINGCHKEGVFTFTSLGDVKAAKNCVVSGPIVFYGGWSPVTRAFAEMLISQKKEAKFIGVPNADVPAGIEQINSEIVEMIGESGIQAIKFKEGKIIGSSFLVCAGPVVSSTEFLDETDVKRDNGYVVVDEKCATNRPNIFACGSVTGKANSWEEAVSQAAIISDILAKEA
ncbi:MAG: FAD-dependent oxidoreductase [Deltaproteobacteria bacterium]